MSEIEYGIIITHDEYGFYAEVPDLDGCSTSGDTFEEVLTNIREAISSYVGSERSGEALSEHEKTWRNTSDTKI